jgi:epoxyqueuosine reductase
LENLIKEILLGLGADDCRIANIDRLFDAPKGFHPREIYNGCKSVIVFIRKMPKGTAFVSPRIIYHRATEIILNELDIISYKGTVVSQRY